MKSLVLMVGLVFFAAACGDDDDDAAGDTGVTIVDGGRSDARPDTGVVAIDASTSTGTGSVGSACAANTACNDGLCITQLPGGYCSKDCTDGVCPAGSECFDIGMGALMACVKTCAAATECRMAEGYICDGDMTCWPSNP